MKMKLIIVNRKKIIYLVLLLLLIISFIYAFFEISINTMNFYDPIYKGSEDDKEIAFACNVVWGNEYLPDIIKTFEEKNIKITFFIGGDWAEKYPELLKLIHSKGHELGNHGYYHKKQSQLSIEQNKKEISETEKIVNKITGYKTELFAPPYGDINDRVVKSAEDIGYKVIMWSIDTIDWNTKDYYKILERVRKKQHNGAIVLMHPTAVTVKALPQLIDELKANNYSIVKVSDILE